MPRLAERFHASEHRRPPPVPHLSTAAERQVSSERAKPQERFGVSGRVTSPVSEVSTLPHRLRAGVEGLSGIAMDDVRVHRNSPEPARLGALAFTRGAEIHLGPGQEQHLPHEAWHVVQQKEGRVQATTQLKGVALNGDAGLEAEADRMGAMASESRSAAVGVRRATKSGPTPVIQRQPANRFDIRTALYRGELIARRLRTEGRISKEVRAQINKDLACYEGAVKQAYLAQVKPALIAVTKGPPIHGPPQVTWSLLAPDTAVPGTVTDDDIYAPTKVLEEREKQELKADVSHEVAVLNSKMKDWRPEDQEFALSLLTQVFQHRTNVDPRAVHDKDRQPILDRYAQWLWVVDQQRLKRCNDNPPSIPETTRAAFHGDYICVSWFSEKRGPSRASTKIEDMRRSLSFSGGYSTAVDQVYADVQVYRLQTDPKMIQMQEDAAAIVDALGALAQAPEEHIEGETPSPRATPLSKLEKLEKIALSDTGALKEVAGGIHGIRERLPGQAVAIVEVEVGSTTRYGAATNSSAPWSSEQSAALGKLGIEKIPSNLSEVVHAEGNVRAWVDGLRKVYGYQNVRVKRWGISAGATGSYICGPCREIARQLGGTIEEF